MLDEREALLTAIFDNPDDDTPRLVYADWLDEHGDAAFAELIRLQCAPPDPSGRTFHRLEQLIPIIYPGHSFPPLPDEPNPHRGFLRADKIEVTADELLDPLAFRIKAASEHPEWFAATRLKVTAGQIVGGVPCETLFTVPVTRLVTTLDLSGDVEEIPPPAAEVEEDAFELVLSEFRYRPVITVLGVEALVRHRSARRLTELDLRNNNLDNDAARLLLRSPYLTRLSRLRLLDGNDLRGTTWGDLRERFGEEVMS